MQVLQRERLQHRPARMMTAADQVVAVRMEHVERHERHRDRVVTTQQPTGQVREVRDTVVERDQLAVKHEPGGERPQVGQ